MSTREQRLAKQIVTVSRSLAFDEVFETSLTSRNSINGIFPVRGYSRFAYKKWLYTILKNSKNVNLLTIQYNNNENISVC